MTPGSDDKGVGQIIFLDNQGVVTDGFEFLGDSLKDSCVVVFDVGDLSVNWLWSIGDSRAMGPTDALVSETYTKDWDMGGLEDLSTDSKVLDIATLCMNKGNVSMGGRDIQ